MNPIDPRVIEKAYVSPGAHELAWRRDDLDGALVAITDSGRAILGGEVWVVRDQADNWEGIIPSRDGSPPGVWSWDTNGQRKGEEWSVYCQRTLDESRQATSKMRVEAEAAQEVVPMLWFNVTFEEPQEADPAGRPNALEPPPKFGRQ